MRNNLSPYKQLRVSPERVAFTSTISAKKKTIHEHWQDPKTYVNKDMTEEDVIELKGIFDQLSSTQCGYLIPADLCVALRRFGFNATNQIVYDIIAQIDEIEKGGISFNEFMGVLQRKPSIKQNRDDIQWAFKKYDTKNKGYIDYDDFKRVARQLEQDITDQQIRQIMQTCGNKHQIRFQDFSKVMSADLW